MQLFRVGLAAVFCLGLAGAARAGANLLPHGDGEDAAATQAWSGDTRVTQNTQEAHSGRAAMEIANWGWVYSPQWIEVDPSKSYELSGFFKVAAGSPPTDMTLGLRFYDAARREIGPLAASPIPSTLTELTADAHAGDRTLRIRATNWSLRPPYIYGVAFNAREDLSDLPNADTIRLVKCEAAGTAAELTLQQPLKRDCPAGMKVRLHRYVDYPGVRFQAPPAWTAQSLRLTGEAAPGAIAEPGQFWRGTKYVRVTLACNFGRKKEEYARYLVDDLSFAEATPAPAALPVAPGVPGAGVLAEQGASAYIIYHATSAPASVKQAATELQRVLRLSTGATLPIRTEPAAPMICLGDNPSALAAGIAGEALPYEHFLIRTIGDNLYIAGRDTPDGQNTPWGGFSRGTQFGVFTFLEQALGVRWIMPDTLGEEIPRHARLPLPQLNLRDGPAFEQREMEITNPPSVNEWALRQKVSARTFQDDTACSFSSLTGHSWNEFITPEMRQAHPEWAAIPGEVGNYKFCTRQPEAVKAFTDQATKWLDANPIRHMVSIAPSDGQSFCRCERCRPFIEKDPHGLSSYTPSILDFYNTVARAVARERPGRMVGGIGYGVTAYPPVNPPQLEPNLFIAWAPLNYYGFGLYKPGYREEFERVAAGWRALTPNVGYTNYLHWHRSESGAPYGPALGILKMELPTLHRLGYRTIYEAASSNWAYGGPTNYLLAKLLWNPEADVDALYREWLQIAYGEGRKSMQALYTLLDEAFRDFKIHDESLDFRAGAYEIWGDKIEKIYLPRLDRIEALYREALSLAKEERQRRRLELFGADMIVFHYQLRKAGYLVDPEKSFFYRTDAQYEEFIQQPAPEGWGVSWRLLQLAKPLPAARKTVAFKGAERRTLIVPTLPPGRVPTIDGRVSAEEWADAAVSGEFRLVGGRGTPKAQTTFRVARNDRNLYMAIECAGERPSDGPILTLPKDDMHIFDGPAVELLLDFTNRPDRFWHLALDRANNRWDGIGADPVPDIKWTSAVAANANGWTAEIAVVLADTGATDAAEQVVRANVGRSALTDGGLEYSSWNATAESFLQTDHFGEWRFAK